MSERKLSFWLLILFLFPHGTYSKSPNKEFSFDSGSLAVKTEADQTSLEDSPALHDSFRSRHKFKTDAGPQPRFYRSELEAEKELEVKIPQCAVMYKNSEPVGILQPFEDSYRFLQVSGEPTLVDINPLPVKRKTIMDVLYPTKMVDDYDVPIADNTAQFTDERYPSIFAKFKIDSRLDKSLNSDIHLKRSMHKRGSEKSPLADPSSIKAGLVKTKSEDNLAVEDELKNILDDMGLIDDYPENKDESKREVEDENLELGTNKISLIKEESKDKRDKREDQMLCSTLPTLATTNFLSKKSISPAIAPKNLLVKETNEAAKENNAEEERSVDLIHPEEEPKVQDEAESIDFDISTVKEAEDEEARKKRQSEKGNKEAKRSAAPSILEFTTPCMVKESAKEEDLSAYEKRVEREIRDKLEKLKNEVKKEITELKESKNKKSSFVEDTKRRKRQVVNTLLDEESVDINPLSSNDEKSQAHIRRKRNTETEDLAVAETKSEFAVSQRNLKQLDDPSTNVDDMTDFIGISPILAVDSSMYRTRTLKQHNEDDTSADSGKDVHLRIKREAAQSNEETADKLGDEDAASRMKRETKDVEENAAYDDEESQFSEDSSYETAKDSNQESMKENIDSDSSQLGSIESAFSTSGCKCDKNNNNCKCGSPKVDLNIPNLKQVEDLSDLAVADSANLLEKKSINQHCNCGKNDNHCKCGHVFDELSSPYKKDFYSETQEIADKQSIDEKEPLEDFQLDSQAKFSRRTRERRRKSVDKLPRPANEETAVNEEEYQDYDSDKSSIKRDARQRKYSAGRSFRNGEYFVDLHPDIYRLSPAENAREKRDSFELVAVHGDNPTRKHLVAIRERSAMPHSRFRRRALVEDDKQPRQLIDMSDEDLFGALPQSYAGELARYKRVKRMKIKK